MNNVYIHPMALVESDNIGELTRIWAFTHICKGVAVGARCNIGEHCFLETGCEMGNDVTVKNGNHVWAGVALDDGVFVGPGVCFTNDLRPRSPRLREAAHRYRSQDWLAPTLVRKGSALGAGAVIIAGVVIGEFSMIAAGAIVSRDVPAHALMIGGPARVAGWVCRCGYRLRFGNDEAVCDDCGLAYRKTGESVQVVSQGIAMKAAAGDRVSIG